MEVVDIPIYLLAEAPWNPNQMDASMLSRLRESVSRYNLVQNLVVRPMGGETFEVLSGNQRLRVLEELGFEKVPCVVVTVDDAHARLLAQALNHVHGDDDLGLKAEVVRRILGSIPEDQVLTILPETSRSLQLLYSLGQQDIAQELQARDQTRSTRLNLLQFQLTHSQLQVVQDVLAQVKVSDDADGGNPNKRGNALYQLCLWFLKEKETDR